MPPSECACSCQASAARISGVRMLERRRRSHRRLQCIPCAANVARLEPASGWLWICLLIQDLPPASRPGSAQA